MISATWLQLGQTICGSLILDIPSRSVCSQSWQEKTLPTSIPRQESCAKSVVLPVHRAAKADRAYFRRPYLFEPPAIPLTDIRSALEASKHAELLVRKVSYDFPNRLSLSTINLSDDHLSITWHRGRGGWERAKAKDFQRDEGPDSFEYRAYRERFDRSVVRFEWRLSDPYSAIMIQLPNEGDEHEKALNQVWQDLKEAGLLPRPLDKIRLSPAFKKLGRNTAAIVQSTRLLAQGGHVDLVSTLSEGGIEAVEAVREVRRGVDDANFVAADGMFSFAEEKYKQLSRTIKMEGHGLDSRLRIWVQCKRDDVYFVLSVIWVNNSA